MNFISENSFPTPENYNTLRENVGWKKLDIEMIKISFAHSLHCITLYANDKIIGMGRITGDNCMFFDLHDIIVDKQYRGQGLALVIMNNLMQYIKQTGRHGSVVGLMASVGVEGLYEKYGFLKRPNYFLGCGMTMLYEQISL